jgi:hypothetical protein
MASEAMNRELAEMRKELAGKEKEAESFSKQVQTDPPTWQVFSLTVATYSSKT